MSEVWNGMLKKLVINVISSIKQFYSYKLRVMKVPILFEVQVQPRRGRVEFNGNGLKNLPLTN